jgi:type IV pilus assembly protein PilE
MLVLTFRNKAGFTLIELMIVVAIIGVLSSIAVPSYVAYLSAAQENDGREDVYRVMAQQERFFLKNMAYTTNLGAGGIGYNVAANAAVTSPEGYFLLSAAACSDSTTQVTGPCIRVTATGQGKQAGTTFWLESDGDQSANL